MNLGFSTYLFFQMCQRRFRSVCEWLRFLLPQGRRRNSYSLTIYSQNMSSSWAVTSKCNTPHTFIAPPPNTHTYTHTPKPKPTHTHSAQQQHALSRTGKWANSIPHLSNLWPCLTGFSEDQRLTWVHDLWRAPGPHPLNLDWPFQAHLSSPSSIYLAHLVCSSAQLSKPVFTPTCHKTCCMCCPLSHCH